MHHMLTLILHTDQEPDHIRPKTRVPALPLVPIGEWPTWPKPGKWHKWALQPIIYHWYYVEWLFAVLYLCCLITYSCMHCRKMLYRLCSLLTNLHISFHHQSDVVLQQGTTFMKVLLSPEIIYAMEQVCQRYIWTQVNQTLLRTGLGHSMSLVGWDVGGLTGV